MKKQLKKAIPSNYLERIRWPHHGFIAVRARDMLQHVFDQIPIDSHMKTENQARLDEPWDGNLPFATLVTKVHAAKEFAQDAGRPINQEDFINFLTTSCLPRGFTWTIVTSGAKSCTKTRCGPIFKHTSPKPRPCSTKARRQ